MCVIFIKHFQVNTFIFMQVEERCFEAQSTQLSSIGYKANQFLWKVREAQAE